MERLALECAVRAALMAAATAAVLAIWRVKSAGARHLAWAGMVVMMLALPLWTAWGPKAPLRVLRAPAATAVAVAEIRLTGPVALPAGGSRPQPASSPWSAVAIVYLLGAGVLLARLGLGAVRAHLLRRAARDRDGRLTSPSCAAPITLGWGRPAVILPEDWTSWPPEHLAAVLAHESEHARRRDPLVQWLALLNRAVFWFHPLAWWLERRLSSLAEEACDAAVLARGADPATYSECLLEMARRVAGAGSRIQVWGMAMPGSHLSRRIRQVLSVSPARTTRTRAAGALVACALLSAAFAATVVEHRQAPAEPPSPAAAPAPPVPTPESPAAPAPAVAAKPATPAQAPAATPAPAQEPRYQTVRRLVMYFDWPSMDDAGRARAAAAAGKFVRTQMQPNDVLAIMEYRGSVRVAQDFTPDHDLLVQVIQQIAAAAQGTSEGGDRLTALETAVHMLAPLDGKKAMIYFAGGFTANHGDVQAVIDEAVRANVAFYPIDARGLVQTPQSLVTPIVGIAKDGALTLNGSPANINDLAGAIRRQFPASTLVYVRIDKETRWEPIQQVTSALTAAKLRFDVVTSPDK
jgi:hypothetical protein